MNSRQFLIRDLALGLTQGDIMRFQDKAVLVDADDWHNPRFDSASREGGDAAARWDRNGLYAAGWYAAKAPPPDNTQADALFADIVRFGGGLGGPDPGE